MKTELKYGPQTEQVEALIIKIRSLTDEQRDALTVEWDMDEVVAREEIFRAAEAIIDVGGWDDIQDAQRDDVWDAVWALVIRDQIGDEDAQEDYDLLTTPWRTTIGSIHPDDADLLD